MQVSQKNLRYRPRSDLVEFAKELNQETLLLVSTNRNAYLYYTETDSSKPIGKLVTTTAADAMENYDYWTRDGDLFWICKW